MPNYESITATFDELIVSKYPESDGKYKSFILVNGEDGKKYQIKLNEHKQRHNINEFIAHYVGNCSDMPLLNGMFLEIDKKEIKNLIAKLDTFPKGYLKSFDLGAMKKNLFFGIEWMQHITSIDDERELLQRVGESSNKNSFYGLYSFDQFMKNYDRHLGNHLIVKIGNSKQYKLIDFDRVFASTNWSRVPSEYTCFTPFICTPSAQRYHSFLMYIVLDSSVKLVHSYAGKIQGIDTKDIKDMCDIISFVYDVPSIEILNIFRWIEYRRQEIVMECLVNEKHFPNITKGLYSVS